MSEVKKEIINRLTKLVNQRKNLAGEIKYDNCIVSTTDLELLLNMINEDSYISKQKIKEIVDECIPKKENIITHKIEYAPNTNSNSYLVSQILKLLQESEE